MKILVDTNIIIDFWRKPTDELLDFFQNEDIVICGAVRSELIQGALSEKQEKIIEDRLDEYYQLSFEEEYWNVLGCMLRTGLTGIKTTTVFFDEAANVVGEGESAHSVGDITFQIKDPSLSNVTRDYYLKVYEVQPDGTERIASDGTLWDVKNEFIVNPIKEGDTELSRTPTTGDEATALATLSRSTGTDSSGKALYPLISGEYNFTYKADKDHTYHFQGNVGKKYCIHVCYRRYIETTDATTHQKVKDYTGQKFRETYQYVKLQNLDYFNLY